MNKLIFIFLFLILIVGCTYTQTTPIKMQEPEQVVVLSSVKKTEICKDIAAYFEWCYINGVDATDCGNKAAEKVIRLYSITPAQLQDVTAYCEKAGII